MINPEKRFITFDEASHTYKDEHSVEYISVTTLIDKFAPKFDKDYWSMRKAFDLGLTQQQVLNQWKEITDISIKEGSNEHKLIEDSVNNSKEFVENNKPKLFNFQGSQNNQLPPNLINVDINKLKDSDMAKKYPEIYDFIEDKLSFGFKLYVEKRVYLSPVSVAGTIDCLLIDTKSKNFIIVDWKTNKDELSFKSGYYKKINGVKSNKWVDKDERFYPPISNLQVCKGIKYQLQLSMYAYMVECWGFNCIGLYLYHLRKIQDIQVKTDEINRLVKRYDLKYLKDDVDRIMHFILSGRQQKEFKDLGITNSFKI